MNSNFFLRLQSLTSKHTGWVIFGLILLAFIVGTIQVQSWSDTIQWVSTFVFTLIVIFIAYAYLSRKSGAASWAQEQGLTYLNTDCATIIEDRFRASPTKTFFNARTFFQHRPHPGRTFSFTAPLDSESRPVINTIPVIQGTIGGRDVWVWPISGSLSLASVMSNRYFCGWCFEISTHRIPLTAAVTKKFLGHHDTLDTESNSFEKAYNISVKRDGIALQLLDPVMMELIQGADISAIEFSDQSVVLYHTLYPPTRESLAKYLYWGTKIAQQVDRNFPRGGSE
ncbi:MAG: hypothetical protein WC289_03170 [Patescibacteria group bacterium]|jgi:hypothetical protein